MSLRERLDLQGFLRLPGLLSTARGSELLRGWGLPQRSGAGSRSLLELPGCRALAQELLVHPELAPLLPPQARAVQCSYFEKSGEHNWLVPMHQDLSVPVAKRIAHRSLSGWSEKEGQTFVLAPAALLAQCLALRLHLDPCGIEDGALRVVPGSHRHGRLDPEAEAILRAATPEQLCCAAVGDVLLLRPLLLHASSKAGGTSRRRVLHYLFGPAALPYGLNWPASSVS